MRSPSDSNGRTAQSQSRAKFGWQATLGRILRDNAALAAALIALAGVLITQIVITNITERGLEAQRVLEEERAQQQQQLEDDRAREAELQTYLDDMGAMLLDDDSPLPEAEPGGHMSSLARAKTLTILERLDGQRQKIVLQFLAESQLISNGEPVISLAGANLTNSDLSRIRLASSDLSGVWLTNTDLSKADLRETNLSDAYLSNVSLSHASLREADLSETDFSKTDLSETNLSEANLNEADLSEAYLSGANLRKADLREADLREVNLSGANLNEADLSDASLNEADLNEADLRSANLSNAVGLTDDQLTKAETLKHITMPDGSKHD
jgi:uncharacterized protein YjbI with pentapeptide repeats